MRTGLFLLSGFLLLAASLILGRLFSANHPGAPLIAIVLFVALWLVVAGTNMWIGVARAGYSVAEELPIFALIFLVPVVVGIVLKWKVV
jgi:hypothetical protein